MPRSIDREISALQKQIAALEAEKAAKAKKEEGLAKLNSAMQSIFEEYGINERDLFEARGKQIMKWAKTVVGEAEPTKLQEKLTGLFTSIQAPKKRGRKPKAAAAGAAPAKKVRRKKKGRPEPKLDTGTYVNPDSKETVQKIKRAPRQLLEWVEAHGLDVVKGWRKAD